MKCTPPPEPLENGRVRVALPRREALGRRSPSVQAALPRKGCPNPSKRDVLGRRSLKREVLGPRSLKREASWWRSLEREVFGQHSLEGATRNSRRGKRQGGAPSKGERTGGAPTSDAGAPEEPPSIVPHAASVKLTNAVAEVATTLEPPPSPPATSCDGPACSLVSPLSRASPTPPPQGGLRASKPRLPPARGKAR